MNPFERFQELKPQILEDAVFMENLRLYAFHDRRDLFCEGRTATLPHLGTGSNNTHYRIGKVGDLWLASREFIQGLDERDKLQEYENYIGSAVRYHDRGKRVPVICGPVLARSGSRNRYFLLLEDLTVGGTANFQPAKGSGAVRGFINDVEVFHDFDDNSEGYLPRNYLAEDKLLIIDR